MYCYINQDLDLQIKTNIDVGIGSVVEVEDMNEAPNPSVSIVKGRDKDEPHMPNDSVMKGGDKKNAEELVDAICSSVELEKLN